MDRGCGGTNELTGTIFFKSIESIRTMPEFMGLFITGN